MAGDRRRAAKSARMDTRPRSTASSSTAGSRPTRRAYGSDLRVVRALARASGGSTSTDVDARVLADYVGELGRGRERLAPASISRRLAAVRSCLRFTLGAARVPDASLAPTRSRRLPDAPKEDEIDDAARARRGRHAARAPQPCAARAPLLGRVCAAPRSSGSTSPTSTSSARRSHVHGKGGKERVVPLGEEAAHHVARYLARRHARSSRSGAIDALFLSVRGRRLDTSTVRAPPPQPAPPAPRLRDASARGRRRPAHDPGAPRPLLALDDADLQPRRRAPPAARLRPLAPALVAVAGRSGRRYRRIRFGAVVPSPPTPTSSASSSSSPRRRSPRTVDAYRRDLAALGAFRDGPVARRDRRGARALGGLDARAPGSPPSTIARRTSAARTYFRHLSLVGARDDNPAAALDPPEARRGVSLARSRPARPSA